MLGDPGPASLAYTARCPAGHGRRRDLWKIVPFVMERMQSTWENQVEINLSESGVHPLTVA